MRVIFAGGGTGGHINPALSVANYAKAQDKDFEAIFVGTQRGLEKKLVPAAGYPMHYINIEGFDRRNMLKNVVVLKELAGAVRSCKGLIKEFKPDCIVCTGGYVSGPVAMAAKSLGVPALIHEQNVYPGLTVKGAEKYVEYVAVSFEETIDHMKQKHKCVVTGNPIRPEILAADRAEARRKLGAGDKPFLLIFGGSLGADKINSAAAEILARIAEEGRIRVLFGTGDRSYDKVTELLKQKGVQSCEDIKVVPYINDMHLSMAAADLAVTRSGAITVSELSALGVPSILIPSPNVVRNHQEQNAREIEKCGGAVVITEAELTPELLYKTINELLRDKKRLESMSAALKRTAKRNALEEIYKLMLKMAQKHGK